MNENITVAVFYTKTCTLDNYLRQEYLKVKPQPTRSFIYQFYINAKSSDLILLVVKCWPVATGGGGAGGAQPLLKAVTAPPLEKLGHNYYILSKTYFLSIQKLNE
jgi:hypothetical protein